jgi:hypothetical protein
MPHTSSGSSLSFAARKAYYLACQGTQAQSLSGGTGVAANDSNVTSGEEETVVDSKESSANQQ